MSSTHPQTHQKAHPQTAPHTGPHAGTPDGGATNGPTTHIPNGGPVATSAHSSVSVPAGFPGGFSPFPDAALRDIKAELRSAMNGIAAARIRESGMGYKLVFGVELPRLQAIAADFQPDTRLAQALWHEDIRECKLLATMLYPTEAFTADLADIWTDSLHMEQAEVAQLLVMNLLAHQPYASEKAFAWMASDRPMQQLLGFLLITRLFMQGRTLSPSAEDEFLDQAAATINAPQLVLKKAVQNALTRFGDTSDNAYKKTQHILCTSQSCNTTSNGAAQMKA